MFYIDPKYPEEPHFSYSLTEGLPPKADMLRLEESLSAVVDEDEDMDDEVEEFTAEEIDEMHVNQKVYEYLYTNIHTILAKHGFILKTRYDA
jgi:hypothetical protein